MTAAAPPPLQLSLNFLSERRATPSDAADVFQSLDDAYRAADVVQAQADPISGSLRSILEGTTVGHGDSPLDIRHFRFGSPLKLLAEVPWDVVGPWLGSGGLWIFTGQLERFWNMPGRIRVESKRLDADSQAQVRRYWEERIAAERLEREYWINRRTHSGRHLQGPVPPPAFRAIEGRLSDPHSPPASAARRRKRKRR